MLPLDDDAELPPPPPPPPAPPPPPPPPPPIEVPLQWLLANGAAPIQYRAIKAFFPAENVPGAVDALTFTRESGRLAISQTVDGLWANAVTQIPAPGSRNPAASVGSATAVHRLLELGWDRESPPLHNARRPLFRLLAEDSDPAFLYELAGNGREPETVTWSRGRLRASAAAALAHAGYERDPRLRGAATRAVDRIDEFMGSPLADDPWVKIGGTHALSPDAFPPSLEFLVMLAFMPEFRNERDDFVDRLTAWMSRPLPKHASAQAVGAKVIPHPHLVLGDPLGGRSADGDIPFALFWLEIMARLTVLPRHEGWKRVLDRMLDDRDRDMVWRPGKNQGTVTTHPLAWPFADLQGTGAEGISVDATFRLGLIASMIGRPVEFA